MLSSSSPNAEMCSFLPLIEGPICTEVIIQIGAQRPALAVALAEAIANGSEEQCEQLVPTQSR